MKRITSLLLSLSLIASLSATTFATDITTDGGSQSVPVELTQQATQFSVTVPTVLPIDVDSKGEVTVATDNKIINNSYGMVEVKGVEVQSQNGWVLQDFETDFGTKQVGVKEYGFQLNGENVAVDGSCSADSFQPIEGNGELSFTYNANIASQSMALEDVEIAQVVFTMGWYQDDTDVFYVRCRNIVPRGSTSPGATNISYNANEYYASIENLSVPISSIISTDFDVLNYGEVGWAEVNRKYLGCKIKECDGLLGYVNWPDGRKTECEISIDTYTINGEEVEVPTLTYTHYDSNGDKTGSSKAMPLWVLDENTKTFTLGTVDTVLTENMVGYSDASNILWNTVVVG